MKSFIDGELFVVSLTHEQTCRLNNGERFFNRLNPLGNASKVEVRPFTDFKLDYQPIHDLSSIAYRERMRKERCVAEFFTNSDVAIYVLSEVSRNAFIAAETIPRESVMTMVSGEDREGLLATLPSGGVQIRFDGK